MAKFNTVDKRGARTVSQLKTSPTPNALTYNGAAGYEYETLSQLFLLSCGAMFGEDSFYESKDVRTARFIALVHTAVGEGHGDWLSRFLPWLRNSANMRTAAIVGAIEAARAMRDRKIPGGRQIVNSVLARADEPGEALAYVMGNYGRAVPKPIKRGIADATVRLYNQFSALKYDTASKGLRFGDVLELVHAEPAHFDQSLLFRHLVTRGKKRDNAVTPDELYVFVANEALRKQAAATPEVLLNSARLRQAGMTWEDALSLVGKRVDKKLLWEALIPTMGYMALLRNLRNFDEAGISVDTQLLVQQKLADPAEVAKSRQLPMRFLSAHRNVPSNNWALVLEKALGASLHSIPTFPGRTLILIDTSGSMSGRMSGRSELQYWEAATVFGLAVAQCCGEADVVSFSTSSREFPRVKGESLLKSIDRFRGGYFYNGGTSTAEAVRRHYRSHDRVLVLTDEQADANYGVFAPVPPSVPCITFNLAGYKTGHAASGTGKRITVGGLSDAAFTLLPALEGRTAGLWPF